jgi:signal transduction histidine kinase
MGVPPQWYALAAATTLLNGGTLGLIAWRERDRALWNWACAWLSWAAAVVPLSQLDAKRSAAITVISCGVLWVVSALCFLRGTYAFAGRRMPRAWYGVAGVCTATAFVLGIGPSGAAGMIPLVLFQSVGLIGTGVLIIRRAQRGAGTWLCGSALMALGLHILDAPLVSERPSLLLWGFVLAACLEMLAALGMLALYYEHARSELIEAHRGLAEKSRVEALGRVAGGVAHDFNNMLTVIQCNLDVVRRGKDAGAEFGESVGAVDQAIAQAARLTAQLLTFGKRSVRQQVPTDAREVVRSTLDLLEKVMPEEIEVRFHSGDGSYTTMLDRGLLEQIVLNLATNARDAITGPGTVRVELAPRETGRGLVLRVADDGSGMDEGVLEQAFDPFFTTKAPGRGTGLGLATVKSAVSQLGGEIRVKSRPGAGTTVEIVLPFGTEQASASER